MNLLSFATMSKNTMFEITGDDILKLSDSDLRVLVARLARAELGKNGKPLSGVTAGGNQDAADGGLDVRVEFASDLIGADFVPKRLTGFQVKKPDMSRTKILAEMRPKGKLRTVIRELANASGAYVIVSAKSSIADKPLADRRKAMRDALKSLPSAKKLHTDFYDRDRLASWANQYPGVVVWIRSCVGRRLSGWSSIDEWGGGRSRGKYLINDNACLIDESSRPSEPLTILGGIVRLRAKLREPGQCIRLVGLSGLGKTRLVQALFEEGVGDDPLDSSLSVYTDYAEEPEPTAREMLLGLIAEQKRAVLIVDNCNPATHSKLAELCNKASTKVSLLTVEYDVRDDEPEGTDVFRLQASSDELIKEWLKEYFPQVSHIDCEKIATFSDGNFRIARALAETLRRGETLGSLKSEELFRRIFIQRQGENEGLLRAAEYLSLLYSIDGDDDSETSELAKIAAISGTTVNDLYAALVEMRKRGVVQARGRYRAILPQAIANRLAADGLARTAPARFDRFSGALTERMLKSVSRRLGFLHDSDAARNTVTRWLGRDGPIGDLVTQGDFGLQIIINIAPVAPDVVLSRFEDEVRSGDGFILGLSPTQRSHWVKLLRNIAYDADLFERSMTIMVRFLPSDSKEQGRDAIQEAFDGFFYILYSRTNASPEQRRALIRKFAASHDEKLRRNVVPALRAMLETHKHGVLDHCDFGARPRDWGWWPKTWDDVDRCLNAAIDLTLELTQEVDARLILADAFRSLWSYQSCRDSLEKAAFSFTQKKPWIDGWIAARAAYRFDSQRMSPEVRKKLKKFINLLKPDDLLNQARSVVLNRMIGGLDFADGEEDDFSSAYTKADELAGKIGEALAHDSITRGVFLPELLASEYSPRAFKCGCGLAEGADSLERIWDELIAAYVLINAQKRNAVTLGGFIERACRIDEKFTLSSLDALVANSDLVQVLPYLQARARLDDEGVSRLLRAIKTGNLVAGNFWTLAYGGSTSVTPQASLATLLSGIASLPSGVDVAIDILHMYFFGKKSEKISYFNKEILTVGRDLLKRVDFVQSDLNFDFRVHGVIEVCLDGEDGMASAMVVCRNLSTAFNDRYYSEDSMGHTLKALFLTQPIVALDTFFLQKHIPRKSRRISRNVSYLEGIQPEVLQRWADLDPEKRYSIVGSHLLVFSNEGEEEKSLSSLYLKMLDYAPDKRSFLGDLFRKIRPECSWRGSLAGILTRRKNLIMQLTEHPDEDVRATINKMLPELERLIDIEIKDERRLTRSEEESFE